MSIRLLTIGLWLCFGCSTPTNNSVVIDEQQNTDTHSIQTLVIPPESYDSLETAMRNIGLINVQLLNPDIVVDLKYSTDSNFLGQNIYGQISQAYLEEEAAKKIALAQFLLDETYPTLRIKVWDAARPVSCQRKMWYALKMPIEEKGRFVSNPKNHSLHNYGCAVDVTLVDSNGHELDMGSHFDQFDSVAQPKYEQILLSQGRLTQAQLSNRWILRKTMRAVGFSTISSEWWHFNSCSRQYAKENYRVIE